MRYSKEILDLVSEGARLYANKDFELSSEKYSDACALFSEQNDADDADLLLLYGKALFQNGVSKSEIFGGNAEGNEGNEEEENESSNFQFCDDVPLADDAEEEEHNNDASTPEASQDKADLDTDKKENDEELEEDKTDFEVSWDILDLARSLFEKKLASEQEKEAPATPYLKSDKDTPTSKYVETSVKLSETYDILGEVSLEAENFKQATEDFNKCLELRLKIYPHNSSLISESHYKLSLALEFCVEDPNSRKLAAEHMKKAIDLVKFRKKSIDDPKEKLKEEELIKDLEARYQELIAEDEYSFEAQKMQILNGILGSSDFASKAGSSEMVTEGQTNLKRKTGDTGVNNLTGIVKKKKKNSK